MQYNIVDKNNKKIAEFDANTRPAKNETIKLDTKEYVVVDVVWKLRQNSRYPEQYVFECINIVVAT